METEQLACLWCEVSVAYAAVVPNLDSSMAPAVGSLLQMSSVIPAEVALVVVLGDLVSGCLAALPCGVRQTVHVVSPSFRSPALQIAQEVFRGG